MTPMKNLNQNNMKKGTAVWQCPFYYKNSGGAEAPPQYRCN